MTSWAWGLFADGVRRVAYTAWQVVEMVDGWYQDHR